MSFDGTAYRGLDDAVVDDGINSDDLPLDVFVEQSIASNSRYLNSGYNMTSVPFYGLDSDTTPTTGERRWASRNEGRALFYPILVERGMTGVKFAMCYACTAGDSEETGVNCELRITRWNTSRERGTVVASQSFTLSSATTYTDTEQTVELPGPWTGTPEVMYLELYIQSDAAGDVGTNVTADAVGAYGLSLSAALGTPEQFAYRFLRSDTTSIDYDVIEATSGGQLEVYPNPDGVESDGTVFSVYEAWYLNIRSVAMQPEYNGLLRGQSPTNEELRAQESIYSTTTIPQISAARRTYSAPRHICFGPAGEASPVESSSQPWYLYRQEPFEEIMIDGVLQDDITGDDSLTAIICWAPATGYFETELDVRVSVTWEILDDGDTGWSDATLIASRDTPIQSYRFPGGRGALFLRQLQARQNESITTTTLNRDSIVYPTEPKQIVTTVIPDITIQSTANATRHSQPGRLVISLTVDDSNFPGSFSKNIYICGYTIVARAS